MKSSIVKGLDEEEAKIVREQYAGSYLYRRQLVARTEEKIKGLQDAMLQDPLDSEDGWALRQATYIAEIKALKKLISLF